MMAMREGMIGLATADSGRSPKHVAPFGGREPRLGTNPISIAVPSDLEGPFCLDMATSAVAAGKIALAVARNEQIPKGWIIDAAGRHTTDPKDYRKGGALLPLGGAEGYKGSGLAAMVEVLCGLLTGLGFGVEPTGRHNDGCFMAVFNVAAFRPLQDFKKEVAEFARYLKSTPPSEGSNGVFYPGEIEYLREQERRKNGIEVEDATWDKLRALATEYKIADDSVLPKRVPLGWNQPNGRSCSRILKSRAAYVRSRWNRARFHLMGRCSRHCGSHRHALAQSSPADDAAGDQGDRRSRFLQVQRMTLSEYRRRPARVRFQGESGHDADWLSLPGLTQTGHAGPAYSVTSSAKPRTISGTVEAPESLPVLASADQCRSSCRMK